MFLMNRNQIYTMSVESIRWKKSGKTKKPGYSGLFFCILSETIESQSGIDVKTPGLFRCFSCIVRYFNV